MRASRHVAQQPPPPVPGPSWVSTVAGSGLFGCLDGPAAEARFKFPAGIGLDHRQPGTLLVADYMAHCVRTIDPSGTVTTVSRHLPGEAEF